MTTSMRSAPSRNGLLQPEEIDKYPTIAGETKEPDSTKKILGGGIKNMKLWSKVHKEGRKNV